MSFMLAKNNKLINGYRFMKNTKINCSEMIPKNIE